jgi:hypothetical protein
VALPPPEQQPELPHDPDEAREALRRHAAEAEAEAAAAAAAMAEEAMAAAVDPGADELMRVESPPHPPVLSGHAASLSPY